MSATLAQENIFFGLDIKHKERLAPNCALAEGKFDLFITADQGLAYEQNLRGRQIAILELSTNNAVSCQSKPLPANYGLPSRAMSGTEFRRLEIPHKIAINEDIRLTD